MVIVEYNKDWGVFFNQIKGVLERNITRYIKIEHIGSTAIVGMWAKPIIDIDITIENDKDFEHISGELEQIGYSHVGDLGITGREAFKRNGIAEYEILDTINHNLYVCQKDSEALKRHLLFRDYLNKHDDEKQEYNKIKHKIIEKYGNEDREKYVSVKEMEYTWFFEKVIKEAEIKKGV